MQHLTSYLESVLSELISRSVIPPHYEITERRTVQPLQLKGKATSIIGARRSGKTTLMHQIRSMRNRQGIAWENLPFISFEDERLAELHGSQLGFLQQDLYRKFPASHKFPVTWFLDEIQHIPQWELYVRRLLDSGQSDVVLSGSSSQMLSTEIATAMRGRGWTVKLFPFSFDEFLRHRTKKELPNPNSLIDQTKASVERAFEDYLVQGGFPELLGYSVEIRQQILRDYVDLMMFRDVIDRHKVRNVWALKGLVRHLLSNAGSSFSVTKFHNMMKSQGLSVARETLALMLSWLEDCFLIRIVPIYTSSIRQEMVNPRKIYPIDPAFIHLFEPSGRKNLGHSLETIVLIELERRGMEVRYVRTSNGYEVDFLAKQGDQHELIQVCANLADEKVAKRECRALIAAADAFPNARLRLLTLRHQYPPVEGIEKIRIEPVWQWILNYAREND